MNKRNSLIALTSLTATFVAICAAVFSVTGIAKLFAGAAWSAAIMASALELGKIVSISFLYQYWKEMPKMLKTYLSISAVVLMIITSAGIYGYLSSAYAKVAATPLQLTADIQTVDNRVKSVEQDIKRKEDRLNQLITLRSQQENRLDQLVSRSQTGNTSTIRSAQNSLNAADRNVTALQNEISKLSAERDSLNAIGIGKQVEIETNGDIGTFVYIAKIFGVSLDTVVKWFTLIIVLVFDPLAVALVIAVNFLVKNKDTEKKETLIEQPAIENLPIKEPLPVITPTTTVIEEKTKPVKKPKKRSSKPKEPYQIYVPETQPILEDNFEPPTPPVFVEPSDPQYFARGDFDWSKTYMWENNPNAVKYYNNYIKSRLI